MSEVYRIPVELMKRLASPTGLAFIIRADLRAAKLKPVARVTVRSGRYVAEIDFETPIGPDGQSGIVVMLGVQPEAQP